MVPVQLVPYTLQWNPDRAHSAAVARFVHLALTADLPPGWLTQPGHLRPTIGELTTAKPAAVVQDRLIGFDRPGR